MGKEIESACAVASAYHEVVEEEKPTRDAGGGKKIKRSRACGCLAVLRFLQQMIAPALIAFALYTVLAKIDEAASGGGTDSVAVALSPSSPPPLPPPLSPPLPPPAQPFRLTVTSAPCTVGPTLTNVAGVYEYAGHTQRAPFYRRSADVPVPARPADFQYYMWWDKDCDGASAGEPTRALATRHPC